MSDQDQSFDVSIVIPVFNAGTTIDEQLDALARQSFDGSWEIVAALQPCTDDTAEVLSRRSEPSLRVVDASAQLGAGFARNVGVAAARADLIAFCDADDVVADDWLAQLYSRRTTAPVLAGAVLRFEGDVTSARLDPDELQLPKVECGYLQSAYTGNMLVERSAFEEVGGFDPYFHRNHDVELSWRLQVAGHRIAVVPEAVVYYRQRPNTSRSWMQMFRWGRYQPALFRKYARYGMRRSSSGAALRSWWWIVTRAPFAIQRSRRWAWLEQSATRSGRVVGSVIERSIYL